MSDPKFTPPKDRWLAICCVVGIIVCIFMTFVELSRAVDGNGRSWAYTFEWPAFAAFIFWIWHKLEKRAKEESLD
ncbi:MAG: hypothetical protein WCK04_05225 [Actinomycetes bacterium]|jgi:hypothetical protein